MARRGGVRQRIIGKAPIPCPPPAPPFYGFDRSYIRHNGFMAALAGATISQNMKRKSGYTPLYEQIKALITQYLVAGKWSPGEPIPSELELASRYRVSQGTVRKAIDELAAANILVRRQGKGTFVATHTAERSRFCESPAIILSRASTSCCLASNGVRR